MTGKRRVVLGEFVTKVPLTKAAKWKLYSPREGDIEREKEAERKRGRQRIRKKERERESARRGWLSGAHSRIGSETEMIWIKQICLKGILEERFVDPFDN